VAIAVRKMANRNPRAMMYERELTREQYMTARWISEPLCLFDNCLESDGALACVLVSAERARDCRQKPAFVHAFAQGLSSLSHTMVNYWCEDPLRGPAWTCAEQLYRNSDFRAADIPVAQIYDAFTPLVPLSGGGRGTIWSFVVPHPPLLPQFAKVSPYNVIAVALEEDPTIRLVGNLVTAPGDPLETVDPASIEIGARVRVVFDPVTDEIHMPRWVLA